jgi:hypothetical protein
MHLSRADEDEGFTLTFLPSPVPGRYVHRTFGCDAICT